MHIDSFEYAVRRRESLREILKRTDRDDIFDPSTFATFPRTLPHKHNMKFIGVRKKGLNWPRKDDQFWFICKDPGCIQQYAIDRWKWEQMRRGQF